MDAAVSTAFVLAVTHPTAGNIGGGGFMIVRMASGETVAVDYREKAPGGSTGDMFLDDNGDIDRSLTRSGYLASGVPGTVRGLALAHERYGRLPWEELVLPAARIAQEGFPISKRLARELNDELQGQMGQFPSSVEAYGKEGGAAWKPGDLLVLRDLGRSLHAIATQGPDVFYQGWIADLIAKDMEENDGLITKQDLASYDAKLRSPVLGIYGEFEIITMPPPSSGGVALIEMLNILEGFRLEDGGRFAPATLHLMVEAMRRAYLDRARVMGDPDFVEVPVERLISKDYALFLATGIDFGRASSSVDLGKDIVTIGAAHSADESMETTHFSVIDPEGTAVSNTYTLEGRYGAKVVVRGTGFLLNNEMGDFNKKPGWTAKNGDIGTEANLIQPGKRMLSSMTPTVVTRNGEVVLVTGSPGGRSIINTVLCVVLNVVEFGMNGWQAVDAPRLDHPWLPDVVRIEAGRFDSQLLRQLEERGHTIELQIRQGNAHSIFVDIDSGIAYGVADVRRGEDAKASK